MTEGPLMADDGAAPIPEEQRGDDRVSLEFYSKEDGSDQFTVELSREDFEHYEQVAANMGIGVEELMIQLVEAQLYEENTQWVLPDATAEGGVDLSTGKLMDLEELALMAQQKKATDQMNQKAQD